MIKRRTRRGILLLSLLAVLTWLLARPSADAPSAERDDLDTRLNYALYDFNGRLLNDEGRVHLEIRSPVLRNDAESGVGAVETPELHIQQGDERWYITAESALVTADREQVSLRGNVFLTRRNEITGQQLDISTRDVLLHVTPRLASTDAEVRIEQAGDRLDARGMNLDMIANRFELLDDVQARYEVP